MNIKDDNNLNEILPDSGKFKVLKEIAISNHLIATLGWADNNFIELGELKLKTGRFPVENNEVAVESYYLDSLDSNWKINESKTFIIDENIEVSLTLVGVVENYSSRWTTVGINYPNMFLSKINFLDENDGNTNFLLEYDTNNSIKTNEINARNYIRENNENGFLNDRLIHHGLKDYEKIMVLSYILQFIILIVSLLCILTIFAYYNSNQVAKYSVFRALGCTTRHLHIIQCLQITIIFILGSLCSIPLILFFRYMIVRTSYGIIEANFLDGLYYINLLWFVILFAIILTLSYLKLRKVNHKGINRNLQVESRDIELLARVNHNKFNIKQLMMQILLYPKQSLLSIFTICFTILLLLFSNTIANELKGGWTTKIDFYLTSQELIGTKLVSGRSVVVTKGLTFSPSDVSKIEQLSGIKHFEKEPFMVDVRAIMKRSDMSKSLLDSRKGHRVEEYLASNDKLIIPDVRYVLMKEDEIRKEYSIGMEENLDSSIIIYIPGISAKERERMLGKNIALSKAVLKDNTLESKEWDFKIIDILDRNYLENGNANKNEITLIMSEDSVFTSGISTGYINLTIYTNENLSVEEKNEIYNSVYLLTAGIPGSLFQYIPDLIHDNTRISDFFKFFRQVRFLYFYYNFNLFDVCNYFWEISVAKKGIGEFIGHLV